jgi:hypothetical protein
MQGFFVFWKIFIYMKNIIKKLLRESINLNLSKQLRKKQLSGVENNELENLFGKNVYRLYYDLKTGKQIFPQSNRDTKIKFDVPIVDKLKNRIESVLKSLDFSLVDFEKNIAKNNKTNQQIKISKVINYTDAELQKKYNEFLDALTKKNTNEEKLLVVISRHSHDIGSMSSKPRISSCEDISDFTNIKQIPDPDSFYGEGYGMGIIAAIEKGDLVFYLIKDNDLNIQDPISRYLEGRICEFGNSSHFYGKYDNNFKNFINNWLRPYLKIRGKNDVEFEDDFYSKSVDDITSTLSRTKSLSQYTNIIKNLISNERYDVIYDLMCSSEYEIIDNKLKEFKSLDQEKINKVLAAMSSLYGYKIFNMLPDNLKNIFFNEIKTQLNKRLPKIKNLYEILFVDFDKTRLVKTFKEKPELYKGALNKKYMIIDDTNLANSIIPYAEGNLANFVAPDLYNQLNQYYLKIKTISNVGERITNYYDKLFSLLN